MKIILKYDEATTEGIEEPAIDILPSVVRWAQKNDNDKVAAKFELVSGIYWAYKYTTKAGTKVVNISTEARYKEIEYEN